MNDERPDRRAAARRAVLSGLLGAACWGTWAALANWGYPAARWRAAATQAALSFVLSAGVAGLVETVYATWRGRFRFAMAAYGPLLATMCASVCMHMAAGTPRIAATMLPPTAIGVLYNTIYVRHLQALRLRHGATTQIRPYKDLTPA